MKHKAHQLITVLTKYTLNVTSLHRYTKMTVYIFICIVGNVWTFATQYNTLGVKFLGDIFFYTC